MDKTQQKEKRSKRIKDTGSAILTAITKKFVPKRKQNEAGDSPVRTKRRIVNAFHEKERSFKAFSKNVKQTRATRKLSKSPQKNATVSRSKGDTEIKKEVVKNWDRLGNPAPKLSAPKSKTAAERPSVPIKKMAPPKPVPPINVNMTTIEETNIITPITVIPILSEETRTILDPVQAESAVLNKDSHDSIIDKRIANDVMEVEVYENKEETSVSSHVNDSRITDADMTYTPVDSRVDLAQELVKHVDTLKKISIIADELNQKTAKNLKEIVSSVKGDLMRKLEEINLETRRDQDTPPAVIEVKIELKKP